MITITPAIEQSIIRFIKLTPLTEVPLQTKWVRDEFDLQEVLEVTRDCIKETSRMCNMPMYAGEKEFNFGEDTKQAVEEYLFSCREQRRMICQRKCNLVIYHLVVEPIIDELSRYSHLSVLQYVDQFFTDVINLVTNHDVDPHIDDAIVMQEIIKHTVRTREELRKNSIKTRKTKKLLPAIELPILEEELDLV